jgi:hypothetical protein
MVNRLAWGANTEEFARVGVPQSAKSFFYWNLALRHSAKCQSTEWRWTSELKKKRASRKRILSYILARQNDVNNNSLNGTSKYGHTPRDTKNISFGGLELGRRNYQWELCFGLLVNSAIRDMLPFPRIECSNCIKQHNKKSSK